MKATTGALIVAPLSVIADAQHTAWLTFRLGRDQERERLASERAAEIESDGAGPRWNGVRASATASE